VTVCF